MPHSPGYAGSLYTPTGRRKYLTPDERARFLKATDDCPNARLRGLCLLLLFTGCRISEALSLTRSAIEPASGFIAIRSLKKRSRAPVIREIPVPGMLIEALEQLAADAKAAPGTPLWSWSRSRAWALVKGVMVEAGIPDGPHRTPKGLRHSFGLHAIRCGIPLNLVQRWLGHASMATTAIYLQAMGEEERQIASRMW